jgi:hypothetical protein
MFDADFLQNIPWEFLFPVTYDRAIDVFFIEYVWWLNKVMKINVCLIDSGESWAQFASSIESTCMILINWSCISLNINTVIFICNMYYILSKDWNLNLSTYNKLHIQL